MRTIFRADASLVVRALIVRAIGAVLFGSLALAAASGNEWQTGVIDPGTGGMYSSLRLDTFGNGHVAYMDSNDANLKYAFWDRRLNKWFTTTLDRTSGFCSIALDSNQRPHISYLEYGTGRLKYTHWTGSVWQKETLEIPVKEIGFYTSIAIGPNNSPSMTFYEYFGPEGEQALHLRNVSWNDGQWELRMIDPTPGSGKFNSIAADSAGRMHVAYGNVKYENASLRYASSNGRFWDVEILEGEGRPGTSMWSVTLLMDKADQPHIAYTDVYRKLVKYATKVNGKWVKEEVDFIKREGYPDRNGMALDSAGNPYISYYDAGTGILKLAHRVGRQWITEVVDQNYTGYMNSMQIYQDTILITYTDQGQKSLKFARRAIEPSVPPLPQEAKTVSKASPRQ